jgi:hypothetical protein
MRIHIGIVLPNGDVKGGINSSHVPHKSDLVLEGGGSGPFPRHGILLSLDPVSRQPGHVN